MAQAAVKVVVVVAATAAAGKAILATAVALSMLMRHRFRAFEDLPRLQYAHTTHPRALEALRPPLHLPRGLVAALMTQRPCPCSSLRSTLALSPARF